MALVSSLISSRSLTKNSTLCSVIRPEGSIATSSLWFSQITSISSIISIEYERQHTGDDKSTVIRSSDRICRILHSDKTLSLRDFLGHIQHLFVVSSTRTVDDDIGQQGHFWSLNVKVSQINPLEWIGVNEMPLAL